MHAQLYEHAYTRITDQEEVTHNNGKRERDQNIKLQHGENDANN